MKQERKTFSWWKLSVDVLTYLLPLGFSWAGPTIVLVGAFLGPGYTALSIILGVCCALGWMGAYFRKENYPSSEAYPGQNDEIARERELDEHYKAHHRAYAFFNSFGSLNALVNGCITFFGSSAAINAWSFLLGVQVGLWPRLAISVLCAVVGFYSSFAITRKRVVTVSRKALRWCQEGKWSDLGQGTFWVKAFLPAFCAMVGSVIMAYYGGFNQFSGMVALVGYNAVSWLAFLGTPTGKVVFASILAGFTTLSSMSLYLTAALNKLSVDAKTHQKSAPVAQDPGLSRWFGQWIGFIALTVFSVVAGGVQTYAIYAQLASLIPVLQGALWSLPVMLVIWYNFYVTFTDGVSGFMAVVTHAMSAESIKNTAASDNGSVKQHDVDETTLTSLSDIPSAP